MLLIALIAICFVGCLWGWRIVAASFLEYIRTEWKKNRWGDNTTVIKLNPVTWELLVQAALVGLGLCWIWPVLLIGRGTLAFTEAVDPAMIASKTGLITKQERQRHKETKAAEKQKQLEAAEKEVGIT